MNSPRNIPHNLFRNFHPGWCVMCAIIQSAWLAWVWRYFTQRPVTLDELKWIAGIAIVAAIWWHSAPDTRAEPTISVAIVWGFSVWFFTSALPALQAVQP